MCTSCLSLGYCTMFAGLQELEEDMIWPFTLRHAANAGVLNKPDNTINKSSFEIKRPFSAGLSSVFTAVEAIFNRVSICDHCCATMPNVSGRVCNKKCKCLQKILLHITPQAAHCLAKLPMIRELYDSMPNNITCHFKLLISNMAYGIMLFPSLSLSTYRIYTCVDHSEEEAQLVGHLAYGNSTISQT